MKFQPLLRSLFNISLFIGLLTALMAILWMILRVTGVSREDLRLALEKVNIESRPLWKPMHMQPLFANNDYYGTDFIEKLFIDGICLPSGSNLTPQEKERISSQLKVVFSC